ncbi:MAG: IS110 family transposase [Firmicutes bacterium]|nr:IS110 family transposase [Bacillota bacterium]
MISVKGIGPVTSAGIIAEVGFCDHLSDESKLAKIAVLTWPAHNSGEFISEDNPLNQLRNVYLIFYPIPAQILIRIGLNLKSGPRADL